MFKSKRINLLVQYNQQLSMFGLRGPGMPSSPLVSSVIGLSTGCLLCFSNMYFGLQSGWVTMGSLQSSLVGYVILNLLAKCNIIEPANTSDNVIAQTVSVASASMPVAAGFIGIIPALGMLEEKDHPGGPITLDVGQLLLWSFALSLIGPFIALPLRQQVIIKEQLTFPSGTATASVIRLLYNARPGGQLQPLISTRPTTYLHSSSILQPLLSQDSSGPYPPQNDDTAHYNVQLVNDETDEHIVGKKSVRQALWALLYSFTVSVLLSIVCTSVKGLQVLKPFDALGFSSFSAWGWTIHCGLGYVGQGMIMGGRTGISMALGALIGYASLGPYVKYKGWAPGEVTSFQDGAMGWLLWVSMALLLGEAMTQLSLLAISDFSKHYVKGAASNRESPRPSADQHIATPFENAPAQASTLQSGEIPKSWWIWGFGLSGLFCVVVTSNMFNMAWYLPIVGVLFSVVVSVLAVRSLGQTDLNPASGVGKLSQVLFAFIAPKQVVPNIIAGAIAEAGAIQSGDMMQDFKTAYLLNIAPLPQFVGMLIGSLASCLFSVLAYKLFTSAYDLSDPAGELRAPTAQIWLDTARFLQGEPLPTGTLSFGTAAFCLGCVLAVAEWFKVPGLPTGVGIAIGMYLAPYMSMPRVVGSCVEFLWYVYWPTTHGNVMVSVASGFVLGEGVAQILCALIKTACAK